MWVYFTSEFRKQHRQPLSTKEAEIKSQTLGLIYALLSVVWPCFSNNIGMEDETKLLIPKLWGKLWFSKQMYKW